MEGLGLGSSAPQVRVARPEWGAVLRRSRPLNTRTGKGADNEGLERRGARARRLGCRSCGPYPRGLRSPVRCEACAEERQPWGARGNRCARGAPWGTEWCSEAPVRLVPFAPRVHCSAVCRPRIPHPWPRTLASSSRLACSQTSAAGRCNADGPCAPAPAGACCSRGLTSKPPFWGEETGDQPAVMYSGGPFTAGGGGLPPPPPILPFQCLRLTAKILLRCLRCQED